MTLSDLFNKNSILKRYYFKTLVVIGFFWTLFDYSRFLALSLFEEAQDYPFAKTSQSIFILTFIIGLIAYSTLAYWLIFPLKSRLRKYPLWLNFLLKTLILCGGTAVYAIINFYIVYVFIYGQSPIAASRSLFHFAFQSSWLLSYVSSRLLLYIITLFALEINEKYSPGVFTDIFVGKYLAPKEENRIIFFIDLKDSTPIAEKLGHKEYFKFIRDVIFCISAGITEHDGRIYQYVGDEIVVWWPASKINARKCFKSLIESRKVVNKNSEVFKRLYDIVPEYKAGIHVGNVTVGQIGIGKKELVMSGDTINTAARIRTACTELNQKFLVSKEMIELLEMEDFQSENLGPVEMKGKNQSLELFALKI